MKHLADLPAVRAPVGLEVGGHHLPHLSRGDVDVMPEFTFMESPLLEAEAARHLVEPGRELGVAGLCTVDQRLLCVVRHAPLFKALQVRSGVLLRTYYLDIDRPEQQRRLAARTKDPLTQWKVSPIDSVAVKHWRTYREARDEMFAATHSEVAPWVIVRTNDKRAARLNLIKALLASVEYKGKDEALLVRDPEVVFRYDTPGKLAR